jgi:hypothetical protein
MNKTTRFSVRINPDEDGFTGRECPVKECEGYFKIQFGTGLSGDVPCHCPYCGHTGPHDEFYTKEQIEYAKSVAIHQITGKFIKELKKLERRPDPHAFISIGLEVEGQPLPIRYYREKKLETEVVCYRCTLRYAIYGVFGYCPDCGVHNSLQILGANLDIVRKMLALSGEASKEVGDKLIENALEDAISSIDGFGREICKVYAAKSSDPAKARSISFQNIQKARDQIRSLFNIDTAAPLTQDEWSSLTRAFQKRHLIAHKMGVIDQQYTDITGESPSLIGRKIEIKSEEVSELVKGLEKIGSHISTKLDALE